MNYFQILRIIIKYITNENYYTVIKYVRNLNILNTTYERLYYKKMI